jgi:hypothetical protein
MTLARQLWRQEFELPRKILMDKQYVHSHLAQEGDALTAPGAGRCVNASHTRRRPRANAGQSIA